MSDAIYRIVYQLEALDGGLNDKYDPNIIEDNESPSILNCDFDDRGGVKTRLGMKKFNTTSVGSFSGDGLFTSRFNNGTEKLVGFWNGSGYLQGNISTFTTIPSAQSIFTAGQRVDSVMYQNLSFYGNGGSKPYKYNGTEFTRMGIPQPNSSPSDTSGTAGASGPATGDVTYKVSYVNSYLVEGDVSAATTTLTIAATATVSLTSIPIAPMSFGVAARKLYRRSAGSGGGYKLVTTINDNTTTTFLDQVVDANLTTTAPTDQGEPPNWQYACVHQERIFFLAPSAPQTLYYTELGNPFVVKSLSFIQISDGDGEIANGLGTHANMVIVGKDASVWLIYMPSTDPTDWIRIRSNSKYGMASHYAQADFNDRKMFIGKRYAKIAGFLALAGASTEPSATDLFATSVASDTQSDKIEPDVFTFVEGNIKKATAIEYQNKLWFAVPYSAVLGTNNRVYQFDFQRRTNSKGNGSWVPFTYPVSFSCFSIYGGLLYAQSQTANGFVYQLETNGFSDDGTAINSYVYTKEFFGHEQHIENQKDFRFGNFIVEALGNYFMNFTFLTDASSGAGTTKTIDLSPGGTVWGSFTWGASTWGAGDLRRKFSVSLDGVSGKRIQLKFDNQNLVNQGFHVFPHGSFSYNLRGKR